MPLNLELYKIFYHVAKHLSFSEAAQELFITQSAVSQAIKQLEEALHCQLFYRTTKNVKLTPEGEMLFQHVEQAMGFILAGERKVTEMQELLHGEVKIGASDTICKYHLLPVLKAFHSQYPQIKIKIINRTSLTCLELLQKGIVDLCVINEPLVKPAPIRFQRVAAIQDVFIAGPKFQELKDRPLKLKHLQNYPILALEKNSVTREYLEAFLQKNNVPIIPEIELGSVELLIQLAKIGLGISFVPREYVLDAVAQEEVFILNLEEKVPPRYLGIATHAKLPPPKASQKFMELVQEEMAKN